MSSLGLNIGLQALLTSQSALDTIGNNITNASTPGYSRQSLRVGTGRTQQLRGLLLGSGVQADVVQRVTDQLLSKRLITQTGSFSRQEARFESLSRAELLFAGDSGGGVGAALDNLFAALSDLSASPSDPILRNGVVQEGEEIGFRLRDLLGEVDGLRDEFGQRIGGLVGQVNVLANEISNLNREVVAAEAAGGVANDLRDRREEAMRQLAELVDVRIGEDQGGVRVLVNGHMLVSPHTVNQMSVEAVADGTVEVSLGGVSDPIEIRGGAIGGLMEVQRDFVPALRQQVDDYARNLIFEFNKVHSTGVPAGGSFHFLASENPLVDQDGDGVVTDELLSNAGLPFDVSTGDLHVRVVDETTGSIERHRISVDATRTTVGEFVNALNGIANLSATVDGQGRVQLSSNAGYAFDFSTGLPSNPDAVGSFGGGQASLSTFGAEPFGLNIGDTLDIAGQVSTFQVTFNAASFQDITQATAVEVAAVLNADPNFQANGLVASDVGGHLVVSSAGSGTSETFQVQGGSVLGALGWTPGTTVVGSNDSVDVTITGDYSGTTNDRFTFRPTSDGTVGTTAGLQVEVVDATGSVIGTLDVGAGYRPGDTLDAGNGILVSFGLGDLSATNNDVFVLEALADSDTTDALAALGINSFFSGSAADSIRIRDDLTVDPNLFAASISGAAGGGQTLLNLLSLGNEGVASLQGLTLSEGYGAIASAVGFEVNGARSAMETENLLLDGLQARRDQISGVNVDEELVNMIEYEQSFQAASQYIRVVSDLTNELLSLV